MFGTKSAIIASSSEPDEMTADCTLLARTPSAALLNSRSYEPEVFLGLASRMRATALAVQVAAKERTRLLTRRFEHGKRASGGIDYEVAVVAYGSH